MSIPEKLKSQSELDKLAEALAPFALFWVALKRNIKLEASDLYLIDTFKLGDQDVSLYGNHCEAAYEAIKDRIEPMLEQRGIDVV